MNEELAKAISDVVHGTKEFVLTQAPDMVQQLIRWEVMYRILGLLFGLLGFVFACQVKTLIKKMPDTDSESSDLFSSLLLFLDIASVFVLVWFVCNIYGLAKVVLVPKVFLFEFLTALVYR